MAERYYIPVSSGRNQNYIMTLPFGANNVVYIISLIYREIAQYWTMSLQDYYTKEYILVDIPLVTGKNAKYGGNLTKQFKYKSVGNFYVVPATDIIVDVPNLDNLGTEYFLVWSEE